MYLFLPLLMNVQFEWMLKLCMYDNKHILTWLDLMSHGIQLRVISQESSPCLLFYMSLKIIEITAASSRGHWVKLIDTKTRHSVTEPLRWEVCSTVCHSFIRNAMHLESFVRRNLQYIHITLRNIQLISYILIFVFCCGLVPVNLTHVIQGRFTSQGLYSLSGKTSYRKISWSLEAARFEFRLFQSLWNLTGTSAAALPRCLSNFGVIRSL